SVAEDAIDSVPKSYRDAALAMGATKWQTIWRVVVPARSGALAAEFSPAPGDRCLFHGHRHPEVFIFTGTARRRLHRFSTCSAHTNLVGTSYAVRQHRSGRIL
ncbi:MAG: ABC transporter permease subunit, partial [Syntrophobacteraceae bacterium]